MEDLLRPERLRSQGLFHERFHERFVLPHLKEQGDYTWQVWSALMFQLWHLVFIEQKESEEPTYDCQAIGE